MRRSLVLGFVVAAALAACGAPHPPRPGPASPVAATPDAGPAVPVPARALPLVPRPRSVKTGRGTFTIDARTPITTMGGADAQAMGGRLAAWLGLPPSSITPTRGPEPATGIVLRLVARDGVPPRDPAVTPPADLADEAFDLDVTPTRALVVAHGSAGLFYGAQTLAQLAGARRIGQPTPPLGQASWTVGAVTIADAPRYRFRAMHLDVSRHFFGRAVVERYVDLLSYYRFNVFHWHLTDDQGFRFEVKAHPELTAIGGKDGSTTQDEARAVVAAARERAITVVPEIEMPGHARAILAAHPELSCTGKKQDVPRVGGVFDDVLCAGNERTYALLGDVLGEVAGVFPSRLVHVGGDEVPTTRWSACPKCRAAMAANKVEPAALEGVFMRRIAGQLAKLGRRPVVWDDASAGDLAPDTIVVAWQGKDRGRDAARAGHDVVMAPYQFTYFNTHQSHVKGEPGQVGYLPWTKTRAFDPLPESSSPAEEARVLGGEGALWTEHIETQDEIDQLVLPRMAALAESLWSGPAPSEADLAARWTAQLPQLDASAVKYFVEPPGNLWERRVVRPDAPIVIAPELPKIHPNGVVRYTKDGTEPTASSLAFAEGASFQVADSMQLNAATFLPNGRRSAVVHTEIRREELRPAVVVAETEPGIAFTYAEGRFFRLPDMSKLTVRAKGHVPKVDLADVERALAEQKIKLPKERFTLLFEGLVDVPADDVYWFRASADDGVRLEIDGEKLLEDDGEHDTRTSAAEIALRRGLHRIRLQYFQGSEGRSLATEVQPRVGAAGLPVLRIEKRR